MLQWNFHAFMLNATTAFYVEEKRVSDCLSGIRDVSNIP